MNFLGRLFALIILLLFLSKPVAAFKCAAIETYAGGGPDSLFANSANLRSPSGVAVDSIGNYYIAAYGQHRIFKVDITGRLTVVAGNGISGFSGDGGLATSACLSSPRGVAMDVAGNLYIADQDNHRIRKVDTTGVITTVAGNDDYGYSGDGGLATAASLRKPSGVTVDSSGNLYIADSYNQRIRKVDTSGNIATVAGSGLYGFSGDGGPATSASLRTPSGVAVDEHGNLYIADTYNHRIRKINTSGIITTIAGNGQIGFAGDDQLAINASLRHPFGIAVDKNRNVFVVDKDNHRIRKVDASGIITTVAGNGGCGFAGDEGMAISARLSTPQGIAVDNQANLYIADTYNNRIRKVDASGIITTVAGNGSCSFAGDGGLATKASLFNIGKVAIDDTGNLFIADLSNNRIRMVDASGIISTVAGNGVGRFFGDGGLAVNAGLVSPYGVAIDSGGNLYIADSSKHRIRKVDTSGVITTIVGNGSSGFAGDGGPATSARLTRPCGIATDRDGNLYIADTGNNRIRKVDTAGIITTVAGDGSSGFAGDGGLAISASLRTPYGVAVDGSGNLFIADQFNHRIRKVSVSGIITTVAGNGFNGFSGDGESATTARLNYPMSVAIDKDGNLFIADTHNHRVRKVTTSGIISTVAGNGFYGFSGDGGAAKEARLAYPRDVAIDSYGKMYIPCGDNRIRIVIPFANHEPVADAGEDLVAPCTKLTGTPVTLDGSGSTDPDDDELTYTWSGPFPEGGGTVTGMNPTVTLPLGTSTVTLVVNDGRCDSAPDSVEINVAEHVSGFLSPLAPLVPEGDAIIMPFKAFKQGRTLPLKIALYCAETPITDAQLDVVGKHPPKIAALKRKEGAQLDLANVNLGTGRANNNGGSFRYNSDGRWIFNLETKGLNYGVYEITLQMPSGLLYTGGFVLD